MASALLHVKTTGLSCAHCDDRRVVLTSSRGTTAVVCRTCDSNVPHDGDYLAFRPNLRPGRYLLHPSLFDEAETRRARREEE